MTTVLQMMRTVVTHHRKKRRRPHIVPFCWVFSACCCLALSALNARLSLLFSMMAAGLMVPSSHHEHEHDFMIMARRRQLLVVKEAAAEAATSLPKQVVLCALVLGEEAYLDEWVDYHLGLGFAHVYIYDNSLYHDLKQWGQEQQQQRPVTVRWWPGVAAQRSAYLDCVQHLQQQQETEKDTWVAFWDVDEFLVLHQHDTVSDFVTQIQQTKPKTGAIAVNWVLMGSSNWTFYHPQQPVTQRFVHPWDELYDFGKRFFHHKTMNRLSAIQTDTGWIHEHFAKLRPGQVLVDAAGQVLPNQKIPYHFHPNKSLQVASLHHYRTKSTSEYLQKCNKGRADRTGLDADKVRHFQNTCRQLKHFHPGNGHRVDASAWDTLIRHNPVYQALAQPLAAGASSSPVPSFQQPTTTTAVAACTWIQPNDEAYLDEWIDFHGALGIHRFYLFHPAGQDYNFLSQWALQKGDFVKTVQLDPRDKQKGSAWDIDSVTLPCSRVIEKSFDWWTVLEVSDFVVLPTLTSSTLSDDTRNHTSSNSILSNLLPKYNRYDGLALFRHEFGTAGRRIYEPRPVTQRFTLREARVNASPRVFWNNKRAVKRKMKRVHNETQTTLLLDMYKVVNTNMKKFLTRHKKDTHRPCSDAVIHSYVTRSKKEHLVRTLGEEALTNESHVNHTFVRQVMMGGSDVLPQGTVLDSSAWEMMKTLNPNYAVYDELTRTAPTGPVR